MREPKAGAVAEVQVDFFPQQAAESPWGRLGNDAPLTIGSTRGAVRLLEQYRADFGALVQTLQTKVEQYADFRRQNVLTLRALSVQEQMMRYTALQGCICCLYFLVKLKTIRLANPIL